MEDTATILSDPSPVNPTTGSVQGSDDPETIVIMIDDPDYQRTVDCDGCCVERVESIPTDQESADTVDSTENGASNRKPQFRCVERHNVYNVVRDGSCETMKGYEQPESTLQQDATDVHFFKSGLFFMFTFPNTVSQSVDPQIDQADSQTIDQTLDRTDAQTDTNTTSVTQPNILPIDSKYQEMRDAMIPFHKDHDWTTPQNVEHLQKVGTSMALAMLLASVKQSTNESTDNAEDSVARVDNPNHFNMYLKPQVISVYKLPKRAEVSFSRAIPNFTMDQILNGVYVHCALVNVVTPAECRTIMMSDSTYQIPLKCVRMDTLLRKIANHVKNAFDEDEFILNILVTRGTMISYLFEHPLYREFCNLKIFQHLDQAVVRAYTDAIAAKFKEATKGLTSRYHTYGTSNDTYSLCVTLNKDIARTLHTPYSDLCKVYGVEPTNVFLDKDAI